MMTGYHCRIDFGPVSVRDKEEWFDAHDLLSKQSEVGNKNQATLARCRNGRKNNRSAASEVRAE